MTLTALALLAALTAPDTGWTQVFQFGEVKAAAVLEQRPRTYLRTDGLQVPGYTVADGLAIAAALHDAGIDDSRVLAQALLGVAASSNIAPGRANQEAAAQGRSCPLTLDMGGTAIKVRLQGGYVPYVIDPDTLQRVRRFSVDDAVAVKQALEAEGYGEAEVMQVWLGLLEPVSDPSVSLSYRDFAIAADPLNPPCNQCQDGRNCNGECCPGNPANCTVCKVCP